MEPYQLGPSSMSMDEAVANIKAIMNSEYFRQYEMSHLSRFNSNLINAKIVGSRKVNGERFNLDDAAGCLDALINQITINPEVQLEEIYLQLYPTKEARTRLRPDIEKARKSMLTRDSMHLRISVRKSGDSGDYDFEVRGYTYSAIPGFPMLGVKERKEEKMFGDWYSEVDQELQKVLPYKLSRIDSSKKVLIKD